MSPRHICSFYLQLSHNFKSGSRDTHVAPVDLILDFCLFELTATRLLAKFEVSIFNGSRVIRGPKIPKVVIETIHEPAHGSPNFAVPR